VDLEPPAILVAPHLRVASHGASTSTTCGNDTAIILRTALLPRVSLRVLRMVSEMEVEWNDALTLSWVYRPG
jgi:hypothetical protein